MRRWRNSPPGSSSTSAFFPLHSDRAKGRTAHLVSKSWQSEYSCSIFLRLSNRGCIEAGVSRRTEGTSAALARARYRMNSSSSRRHSRTYSDISNAWPLLRRDTSLMFVRAASANRRQQTLDRYRHTGIIIDDRLLNIETSSAEVIRLLSSVVGSAKLKRCFWPGAPGDGSTQCYPIGRAR